MFGFKPTPNKNEYPSFLASALAIHGSVTPKVLKQVMWVALYATAISYVNYLRPHIQLPIGPFEYAGFIMGLILVFRINAGYERWWEARKIWGDIVNKCRNLATILLSYSDRAESEAIKKHIKIIAALPYCVKKHLRETHDYDDLAHLLETKMIQNLKNKVKHPVLYLSSQTADFLNQLLKNNKINQFAYLKAEEQRERLIDSQGACERILKTPMPFVMAIKSRRFILLFLIVLPFALVNLSIYVSPFVTSLVAYTLFSLDQIGIELQNPFWESNLSHLPLTKISNTIEGNLTEMLDHYDS